MSYPNPILKLTWGGAVRTDDIWTNGVHIAALQSPDDTATLFENFSVTNAFNTIKTAYISASGITPYCTLAWAKLAYLDEDGKYLVDAKLYEPADPSPGTNTNDLHSPQDSFVISLLTAEKRGLANRGRIYPPAGFATVGTDGLLSSSGAVSLVGKFTTMFNAINTEADTALDGSRVVIASKERAGAIRNVTTLSVGNLLDTQNRRRNKLHEVYTNQGLN